MYVGKKNVNEILVLDDVNKVPLTNAKIKLVFIFTM